MNKPQNYFENKLKYFKNDKGEYSEIINKIFYITMK